MTAPRLRHACALLLLAPALAALAADKDSSGDPLPEGAKARIGTSRLRVPMYSAPVLTPDAKSLYVQGGAGTLRVDPSTGQAQGKVPGDVYGTPSTLSADGKRAAQFQFDKVTVWDTQTGKSVAKVERRLPGTESAAALSADGKVLAIGGTGDAEKKEGVSVLVWDVDADKQLQKLAVPQNQYASVAVSPDGKTVASWGGFYDPQAKNPPDPKADPNRLVQFWDAATGKELSKFHVDGYTPSAVAFSPDGSSAAVASNDSTIQLVDPKTGKSKQLLVGRSQIGKWVAFSPDGATVASTSDGGAVQRWKAADGSLLSTTEAPAAQVYNARVRVLSNDRAVAWGVKGVAVLVWEVPSGKLMSPEGGHFGLIRGVAVTPDSKFVITSAEDGATKKWELATGKPAGDITLRQPGTGFGGYGPAATFPTNPTRALAREGNGFAVYDVSTGTQQYALPSPFDSYAVASLTPDGSKAVVASANYDGKKPAQVSVWDAASARRLASLELPGYNSLSAAATPDGKHVVTAGRKAAEKGSGTFVVAAWDAATGAKKGEYTEEAGFGMPHVAAGPDNAKAAVVTPKGALVVFDLATGKLEKTFDLKRNQVGPAPVFSADGKRLAVACQGGYGGGNAAKVFVFDWPSGEAKHTFNAPGGTPTALAFSPDGKWLVTAAPDTTATVWDVSK